MTRILVTGATGTIGSELVTQLATHDDVTVLAGVREPDGAKARALAGPRVTPVFVDLDDPARSAAAFEGAERVFLLTPFVEDPLPLVRSGVALATDGGARFVVRLSAAGASPDAPAALARHHAEGERIVAESGLPHAVLRPTFFMDNLVNFAAASIAQGRLVGAAGDGAVAYVSGRDVAAVAAAMLRDPEAHVGRIAELTGPEALQEREVARLVGEALGRPVEYVSLSAEDYAAGLREMGMPGWVVEGMTFLEGVKAAGWAAATTPEVATLTGRPPETLRAFLARSRARLG